MDLAKLGPCSGLVNTHEAKSRPSELTRLAEAGETVILARGGKPVARIVAWPTDLPTRPPKSSFHP